MKINVHDCLTNEEKDIEFQTLEELMKTFKTGAYKREFAVEIVRKHHPEMTEGTEEYEDLIMTHIGAMETTG